MANFPDSAPTASASTPWVQVFVLWACGVVAGLQLAKISAAFTAMQAYYTSSAAGIGSVLSAMGLVGLVGGVSMGLLAPRWGLNRTLVTGLALGALVSAVQATMLPLSWLWATRLLEGLSHLAVVVSAPTLIVRCSAPQHRALLMGAWGTFVAAAYALAGALAPCVVPLGLPVWLLGHATLMALAAGAAAASLGNSKQWPGEAPRPWIGLVQEHRALYARLESVLPALCFFCYTSMALAFMTFLPSISGPHARWVAVLLPLCGVSGTLLAGVLIQRRGRALAWVGVSYGLLAMLAAGVNWQWAQGGLVAPWAMGLMLCAGLAAGSSLALVPALNPTSAHQAQANGAIAQWGNLGAATTGPLFGWVWPQGAATVFALILAYSSLGLALSVWGHRRLALH